jgi:RNA polymerase sigma-70 factor (ECF subfamily)
MEKNVLINDMDYKDEEVLTLSMEQPSLFELLVDRYQNDFLRAALRVVRSKEEAEDIVQNSFVKIYLNAKKFKPVEGASFRSWAYKIVLNTSFNHYKKLKRIRGAIKKIDPDVFENLPDKTIEDFAKGMDIKSCLDKILPQVPSHLRAVLEKYYLDDKSQREIAEEEGISASAVKTRLFRAKKIARTIIGQNKNLCLT